MERGFFMVIYTRKTNRLKDYDYSRSGYYFVTICTDDRVHQFGNIVDGQIRLNQWGKMAQKCWQGIPDHFPSVELDEYVVMPNHIHGIIIVGAGFPRPDTKGAETAPLRPTLGQIVAYFKYQSTKHINIIRGSQGRRVWQRNYWEHVIRNENDLNRTREYIRNNPVSWDIDENNI